MASDRFRSSARVALSIVLAYGVALWLDWDKPYWAGLAVAVCTLATTGESLRKGLLRLGGTLVAVVVATALIAVAAQDRWAFAVLLSAWLAMCFVLMGRTRGWYLWQCAGTAVPLLTLLSDFEALIAFEVMALRAQETALGIACYTLVSVFFLHESAKKQLRDTVTGGLRGLSVRLAAVRESVTGAGTAPDGVAGGGVASQTAVLPDLLAAAVVEGFDVRERRLGWRALVAAMQDVERGIDRLSFAAEAVPQVRRAGLLSHVAPALDEFAARLAAVAELVSHGGRARPPRHYADEALTARRVSQDQQTLESGAVLLVEDRVRRLDTATRSLGEATADVSDLHRLPRDLARSQAELPARPDPEQLALLARQQTIFWLAFLVYIFVPGLPGGAVAVIIAASVGLSLSKMPTLRASSVILPGIFGAVYGGGLHIFVMPHLDGYLQLAVLLFAGSFTLCWLFHARRLVIARSIGLALLVVLTQVSNEQSYSVTYVLGFVVQFAFVVLILTIAQHVPFSWKPEIVLRRLLRRYADTLATIFELLGGDHGDRPDPKTRKRLAAQRTTLAALPPRIATWARAVPDVAASAHDRAMLVKIAGHLEVLSLRIDDIVRLGEDGYDPIWFDLLHEDVRAWRVGLLALTERLAAAPDGEDIAALQNQLQAMLERLETRVADAAQTAAVSATSEGTEQMQRILATYRSVSESILAVAQDAQAVDWLRLRDARF